MTLKLDENQQKAVEHFQGPALVIAGPGSGKTTVIKERILHLIREHNVNPGRILALAFNKEAAKEMEKRILSELGANMLPEIRTLHAFGLRIINEHYDRLKWQNKPEVWASDPEKTIKQEIQQLKRNLANVIVTIYKIESELTGKCYIGQTTNPDRRRGEHFSFEDSSNPGLRQAMLNEGKEHFNFYLINTIEGKFANRREAEYIEYYRNCAVINLVEPEVEQLEADKVETRISIYKIENKTTGVCYIVQSIDTERNKVEDFTNSSNEEIRNVIEDEGIDQFTFDILHKDVPNGESFILVEHAIKNASNRSRAVFNQKDPLTQRYSDQLMIELFCEHFNIRYEDFLKHPSGVENLAEKVEDFEKIIEKVQKAKRETNINFTSTSSTEEIVHSIIESIDDPVVQAFAKRYEKKKRKANAIDFQDMILYAVYLLEVYPDILDGYREKYDYVHIDEFQDVSPIDFRLTKPLSENYFVVGDDDQAIYGFRGGNSEIMLSFHKQENVQKYKITRNYRSTSTIVEHSKNLIEHNTFRISKNLHAENSIRPRIKVLATTGKTVKSTFLREFAEPVCQIQFVENRIPMFKGDLLEIRVETQNIGIPVRYRSEVDKIRQTFRSTSFTEIKGEKPRKKGESFKIIGRSKEEIIEVSTIHKMKGKEYDKVIFIHNTLEDKDFPFQDSDDITEDRRVFYVAMTRAKRELVILGGDCQFVTEAGLSAITRKRKKRLEKKSGALNTAIMHRIDLGKKIVDELSETMQTALISILTKHVEVRIEGARKQCEYKLGHLRSNVEKVQKVAEDTARQLETQFPTDLKAANEDLLEDLIPVLDAFESQTKNLPTAVESTNESSGFAAFAKNVQLAHIQLLDSLKNHGLKPIGTSSGAIFNSVYHEELSPEIYSNGVPAGTIARQEQRGYLLHDQIVRKVRVVISKRKQRADALLCQDFAQPIRFVTYAGFCDLRNIETFKDEVKGQDSQGKTVQLQNLNLLFAFPKDDMESLKSHIKIRRDIADQNLQPIELISERFHVPNDVLKLLLINPNVTVPDDQNPTVELVTRSGHLLTGHLRNFDEEFLYMHIKQKIVIVYRAGILRFKNLIWNEITKAYKNSTPIEGHIVEQSKKGLRVKYKSLTGFLPASQVELSAIQYLDSYIGKTYEMMVIKINAANNHFVLSRKVWLLKEQNTKLLKSFSEVSEVPPQLRNIKRTSKTVEPIPGINDSTLVPKAECIPLNEPINVIVPEPVEEMIDTSPPISIYLTESLDTYVKDLKPEPREIVEVQSAPLYEPIDLIVPESVKKVVDSRIPKPKHSLKRPNPQTQDITPESSQIEINSNPVETVNSNAHSTLQAYEDFVKKQIQELEPGTLESSIVSDPPIAVSSSTQETPQEHEDILNKQIQELKPDTSDSENPDNVIQQPALETGVDRETPVESTTLTLSDSSAEIDSDTRQIKVQDSSENKVENGKKSFRNCLSEGGRFVVEKIKVIIFRKPSS